MKVELLMSALIPPFSFAFNELIPLMFLLFSCFSMEFWNDTFLLSLSLSLSHLLSFVYPSPPSSSFPPYRVCSRSVAPS